MSKAVNSPTARLLQSSRLFSLPRPLPAPDLGSAVSGTYRSSDTATNPYPTHQAIATPASSLHRGDWGLKRSLPQKRLRGTNPTVRVRAQDTWEHVTSFESAGDHVRTLEKWNEMGIPMEVKKDRMTMSFSTHTYQKRPESVYDDVHDTTDRDARATGQSQGRWKYKGPWLSGMQEGEFQQWLLRQISTRRTEWLDFLRTHYTEQRVRNGFTAAREQGEPLSEEDIEQLRATSRPTDEDLVHIQKQLRDYHEEDRLGSDLTRLITTFLDLPPLSTADDGASRGDNKNRKFNETILAQIGSVIEQAPPVTHPGAGISHIRTNAIMENHPLHGPQAARTPIQARIVRPRVTAGMPTEHNAKLGVAGVVADDEISATLGRQDMSRFKRPDDPAQELDPKIPGGAKVWVQPRSAYVDEKGRIQVRVARADREAVAVRTGEVEEIHAQKRQGDAVGAFGGGGEEARYGTALPDQRSVRQRPQVKGFDGELGRRGREEDPASAVADLMRRDLANRNR